MALLVTVLLLGALRHAVPSDAKIAAAIETQLRTLLHPAVVQVTVHRTSPFSTTFERVDITIEKFNLDALSMPSDATPVKPTAMSDPPSAPASAGGQTIRIIQTRIECRDFTAQQLEIPTLVMDAHELHIPLDSLHGNALQIAAAESVTGYLLAPQASLTNYLRTLHLPITDPRVTITPDGCRIDGTAHAMINLPVQLTGRIMARDGAVLYFDAPKLKVSVIPLPASLTNRLLRSVNPLIDLNASLHLPAPLTITGITHQPGMLRLDMALRFPLPEPNHVNTQPN